MAPLDPVAPREDATGLERRDLMVGGQSTRHMRRSTRGAARQQLGTRVRSATRAERLRPAAVQPPARVFPRWPANAEDHWVLAGLSTRSLASSALTSDTI